MALAALAAAADPNWPFIEIRSTGANPLTHQQAGAFASRHLLVGMTLYLSLSETINTNGSAAGSVNIGIPLELALSNESHLRAWEAKGTKGLLYVAGPGQTNLSAYLENPVSHPGADGARPDLSVVVEVP